MSERYNSVDDFAELSSELTGFTVPELEGTGLVESYFTAVSELVGERIFGRLLINWDKVRSESRSKKDRQGGIEEEIFGPHWGGLLGPIALNIVRLWYLGNWYQMPREWRSKYGAAANDQTRVVSAEAYREGLVWNAICAHPTAAKQPGFGSWAFPPKDPYRRKSSPSEAGKAKTVREDSHL
jgi:hypothetical protein